MLILLYRIFVDTEQDSFLDGWIKDLPFDAARHGRFSLFSLPLVCVDRYRRSFDKYSYLSFANYVLQASRGDLVRSSTRDSVETSRT